MALVLLWPRAPLLGLGLLVLSHALILYPTLRPNAQWLGPVVTRFETPRREVWLTVDDGPAGDTPALLDLLGRHGVRAAFFVKGTLAAARPDLVQEMLARGHVVANHSHTHPSGTFWCALPRSIEREIDACDRVLRQAGAASTWFRAPVGMKNPFVHPALDRRRMRLIGWTARGFDGVLGDVEQAVARLLPDVAPGAIVLLHQGRPHSLQVIERAIVAIRERGYAFVIPEEGQFRAGR